MILSLRMLHLLGIVCFGGFITHDLVLFFLAGGNYFVNKPSINLFYFFTLPLFILLLLTGIVLTVQRMYILKKESWLKKKFAAAAAIMFLLILGVFPVLKQAALNPSTITQLPIKYPLALMGIFLLFVYALYQALHHREMFHEEIRN